MLRAIRPVDGGRFAAVDVRRALDVLRQVGVGYLRLGQPATELSGGEAQRIKLAAELQRAERGDALYVLDEPTTGLHPSDVDKLIVQLNTLVDAGNTVVVVEHEIPVIQASDWVIDIGPGAADDGGRVVAASGLGGKPAQRESRSRVADLDLGGWSRGLCGRGRLCRCDSGNEQARGKAERGWTHGSPSGT